MMDSDSDFYGDEETISALETRVNNFDVAGWWNSHRPVLTTGSRQDNHKPPPTGPLYNRYEGDPSAWQPNEPIDSFLARLPPATTDWSPGFDWIWVANPYVPPGPGKSLDQFKKGGEERLGLFTSFEKMAASSVSGKSDFAAKREVAKERKEAVEDLQMLAETCNVVSGKWMLFPEPGNVNHAWAKVARATANNELGVSAKVATRAESEKERLICIYTKNFRDKDDVARVLNRMRELELIRLGGRQIYYKSDAWTYLGIYGGNSWGIGASMYSSNEVFSYIKSGGSDRG